MMTSGASALFIDTNILVYATNLSSPLYKVALDKLVKARQSGTELIISIQTLREFLATTVRLKIQSMPDILQDLKAFQNDFKVVEDNLRVFNALENIVQNFQVGGRKIYDANIVATMVTYQISHLLTHNVADFNRFVPLITVVPLVP
jgi:predicted nucleic acid-binding protein